LPCSRCSETRLPKELPGSGRCHFGSGRKVCLECFEKQVTSLVIYQVHNTYNLAPGIYLFLGYSQTDENLLKPFTGLTIPKDVVAKMQFLMGTAEDPED
ncbi:hypothetical protein QYM36_005735, partial [Artemia franciscana]